MEKKKNSIPQIILVNRGIKLSQAALAYSCCKKTQRC